MGGAGGTIIAHEVTKLASGGARNVSPLYEGTYALSQAGCLRHYLNKGTLQFAGEQWTIATCRAHTNGDLFVHFPKRNVLVVADRGFDRWPVIDYLNGGFCMRF